ncbi:MAG: transcriptional regulator [Candidatus Omnitrophica bacterium CG11_big_fil_rev_8_21_14_0_20_45_26]|uniref:Transcriptional regulator n=1 Tax=Candidatus Abzuiibacterium crystallinum TaxID=1974748 RepID=A0A2H0LSP1_9BACT|nr:MAG: transcriptional regulator [Candidatus Omnitrophica bacterium CG11_big_fil_rev_8_21_14_0_20_45_26]PIW64203.1 MAG: transcriptional regulator [Candidatus Omnitrophica bacterium CG12_big_fil_rev_8_21_14_0_65_45_16]
MKTHYLVGIDVGGTKISVVLGTPKGRILFKRVIPTQTGSHTKESIRQIVAAIQESLKRFGITAKNMKGIGIGVPGPVDPKREEIEHSPNLKGWRRVPLKHILKKKFRCPVFIENDANAAALGEKYFGSGRNVKDFAYITVSTGVGCGMIVNHQLVRGVVGSAGEIGHVTVEHPGGRLARGKRGCLEAYASGTAIAKRASQLIRSRKNSRIYMIMKKEGAAKVQGWMVSQAADQHDPFAIQLKREAADYLGIGIGTIINLLNPKLIILGGGVMEHAQPFWKQLKQAVQRESWPYAFKKCKIIKTRLRGRVGDLGAIAVVIERLQSN